MYTRLAMLRGREIVATAVLCAALGAARLCSADLTVNDVDYAAYKPLSEHAELSCGEVVINHCGGKELKLANVGNQPIAVDRRIEGDGFEAGETGYSYGSTKPGEPFSLDECRKSLSPGAKCTWGVDFCPDTLGAKIGSFEILLNGKAAYRFRLRGIGVNARPKK